ncbi:hypothetical protein Tco_0937956 [Tanacetum coccineum]|uniref:DUF4283 domain-containing protein n=1 Tax=Tanacetum coccineum TaxID=301880 RepID=A0ABQ5DFR5_9ASTR
MGAAQISNTVDDVGKDSDGVNSSHTKFTPVNSAVNKEDTLHDENDGLKNKGTFYDNLFTGGSSRKAMNFRTLFTPRDNGVDVIVLVESIRAISEQFANTAYGFFLRKRVAYPVVANYVRNTWGIYGSVKLMLNSSTKIFSIQFSSIKEDVGNVLVWVKLHGVLVTAFSDDGLSVIATKLVTPLMLVSYTSDMCIQSWGRSSYARAMIEVRDGVELKDNIVVAMLKLVGDGFYTCNVRVEYEWKSLRENNLKKPSQAPRGVSVGPKVGFKPTKQAYRAVPKQTNANTRGGRNKDVEPPKEGKPVEKFDYSGNHDSEGLHLLITKESYVNGDYDFDPYDDDMYEGQDIPDKIQDICNNLDIKVLGRKKK